MKRNVYWMGTTWLKVIFIDGLTTNFAPEPSSSKGKILLDNLLLQMYEIRHYLYLTLEQVMEANVEKLRKRYPEGFDVRRSQHQHFPRKEDLFVAIFGRGLQLFEQMVQLVTASDLPAQAKLEQILLYVYKEQRGRYAQLFQLLAQQAEIRSSLREREGHLRGFLEQSTQQIRAILEEGKASGEFDETISTELMLLTFMRSLTQSKREQLFVCEHLSPDELVRQIGQILFHGFACKK